MLLLLRRQEGSQDILGDGLFNFDDDALSAGAASANGTSRKSKGGRGSKTKKSKAKGASGGSGSGSGGGGDLGDLPTDLSVDGLANDDWMNLL